MRQRAISVPVVYASRSAAEPGHFGVFGGECLNRLMQEISDFAGILPGLSEENMAV